METVNRSNKSAAIFQFFFTEVKEAFYFKKVILETIERKRQKERENVWDFY